MKYKLIIEDADDMILSTVTSESADGVIAHIGAFMRSEKCRAALKKEESEDLPF